jgi:hypothetical protein
VKSRLLGQPMSCLIQFGIGKRLLGHKAVESPTFTSQPSSQNEEMQIETLISLA